MPSLIRSILYCVLLFPFVASSQGLTFRGLNLQAVEVDATASSGLNKVYVLPYIHGVTAAFSTANPAQVTWQRYSKLGGGYAEDVTSTAEADASVLSHLEGDMGYIVTDGTKRYAFWVADYSSAPLEFEALTLSPESDCSTMWLDFTGTAAPITAYGITGAPVKVSRELELTYSTLEFDPESFAYRQVTHTEVLESAAERIHCTPPLCQTDFTLSGDRFTRAWGEEYAVTSPVYDPMAVDAQTEAEQTTREVENEVRDDASSLGGSAPAEITFRAAVTDAALYHEWEVARDPEFVQSFLRYTDLEFTYTFREQGTFYVRLSAANDSGGCEYESETYQVSIGNSSLQCPNAFTPGTSEGVNDEWKVSYKSIVSFDCQIFDRNGRRLAHLTDPSQGWDGKVNGKVVPNGVYFYVIKAKGADGKNYKLSGDINTIGYKKNTINTDATEGL